MAANKRRYAKRSINNVRDCQAQSQGVAREKHGYSLNASPYLRRTIRMSSPLPPVSNACPLDFDHLSRMTLGEKALQREVLEMFLKQAGRLLDRLAEMPSEASAL